MKAFNTLLHELNDGSTHAALSADLAELLRAVQHNGRAGSLTLKLRVAPATKGHGSGMVDKITVTAERKLELPKPEQPQDFFWLTEEGETSRKHPRQHDLPLREVANTDADGVITFKEASK